VRLRQVSRRERGLGRALAVAAQSCLFFAASGERALAQASDLASDAGEHPAYCRLPVGVIRSANDGFDEETGVVDSRAERPSRRARSDAVHHQGGLRIGVLGERDRRLVGLVRDPDRDAIRSELFLRWKARPASWRGPRGRE
jgi:hypothetical protein